MTDCKLCQGYGWIIVGRPNGNSGAKPCDCRRTQETESALGQTPLTPETAAMAVKGLCEVLDYAPPTEIGQGVITSAVLSMCSTTEQAMWLVQRACTLHTRWSTCGIPGLRQMQPGGVTQPAESSPNSFAAVCQVAVLSRRASSVRA